MYLPQNSLRVETVEQGILLRGFEDHLNQIWDGKGRFKDTVKVFSMEHGICNYLL